MENFAGNFKDLFPRELEDLYSGAIQLTGALPKAAAATSFSAFTEALLQHLESTRGHVRHIKEMLTAVGVGLADLKCAGMEGLIREWDEAMRMRDAAPQVVTVRLIVGGQKIGQYQIAAFASAREIAVLLGYDEIAQRLKRMLFEEICAYENYSALGEEHMLRMRQEALLVNAG